MKTFEAGNRRNAHNVGIVRNRESGAGAIRNAAPAAPDTTTADPEVIGRIDDTVFSSGYIVVVYDNDKNTYDEVVAILLKATGCTLEEAQIETWEVDKLGKSVVHHGGREECDRAAGIIRTIGIRVEVVEE